MRPPIHSLTSDRFAPVAVNIAVKTLALGFSLQQEWA
jgi:hypothetical protein